MQVIRVAGIYDLLFNHFYLNQELIKLQVQFEKWNYINLSVLI
jgi:hypothetical protein